MRTTAFLGAGAVAEIGGPRTSELTQLVRAKAQNGILTAKNVGGYIPFLDQVASQLDQRFSPSRANFEDIYHALEMLRSCQRGWQPRTAKEFRPHLCAFTQPISQAPWFDDPMLLNTAEQDLITTVADRISGYEASYAPDGEHSWFARFWRAALRRCSWDIATLNYDTCVERSVAAEACEDGFEVTGEQFMRFNPTRLTWTPRSRILHLHGCLRFGYPRWSDPNTHIYEDDHEDLYRYPTYEDARETWFGRSTNRAQSGEDATAGPIITGLRKPDKLLCYPYSTYHTLLDLALQESPRLLVAGYSFGDLHFNMLLNRATRLHGPKRRIVVVTRFPDPEDHWHPDPAIMDWLDQDAYMFIAKAFKDGRPFKSFRFASPITSQDGCARIYLSGVRDAFECHGEEIIDFLIERRSYIRRLVGSLLWWKAR